MPWRIIFVDGPEKGASYPVSEDEGTVVGRSPTVRVIVRDNNVSRAHCQIRLSPEGCIIDDLGSTNGTHVNEERVTEALLKNGDLVRIGASKFRLINEEQFGQDSTALLGED